MRRAITICLLSLSLAPGSSLACSLVELTASEKSHKASAIVLAAPIEVSITPEAAKSPSYEGEVVEIIRWKTLVSWKGRYRPGQEFKTVMAFEVSRSDSCMSWSPSGRAPEMQILYLHGKEPFDYYYSSELSEWDAFELLGKYK